MTFTEAVSAVLTKYADFTGRARRSEFWWFVLFNFIVSLAAMFIDNVIFGGDVISLLAAIALFLPGLAVGVRRLHDVDRSGWWILIALIPILGAIVLIVWGATEGSNSANRFGPQPA